MSHTHDSARYLTYLQHALSQDKRPLGFLLGAGCPASIRVKNAAGVDEQLVPTIQGLSDLVATELRASSLKPAFERIENHLRADGKPVNLETELSFVRGLRAVAGGAEIRSLSVADLDRVEDEICRLIGNRVDRKLPTEATPYAQLALWIGSTSRSTAVELFTTNYDLLTEQALERFRIPYFDGFSGSNEAFLDSHSMDHDQLPSRWARLWKLHGSINWHFNDQKQICRGSSTSGKCMIHPSHLKFDESRRMPYLVMIDRLRSFIRKPSSILTTCGYSFRDEHLNACILEGLTGSPRSSVFALLHGNLASYPQATQLASIAGNLSLLATDGAVVGTVAGLWSGQHPPNVALLSGAVEVSNAPSSSDPPTIKFCLGDFERLGRFINALLGYKVDSPDNAS